MKKTEDGKTYIQVKDILFIEQENLCKIPKTIFDKIFNRYSRVINNYGRVITPDAYDSYIELDTKEELEFLSYQDYILDENYLEELSYEKLLKVLDENYKKLDKNAKEYLDNRNNASFDIRKNDKEEEMLKYIKTVLLEYKEKKKLNKKLELINRNE